MKKPTDPIELAEAAIAAAEQAVLTAKTEMEVATGGEQRLEAVCRRISELNATMLKQKSDFLELLTRCLLLMEGKILIIFHVPDASLNNVASVTITVADTLRKELSFEVKIATNSTPPYRVIGHTIDQVVSLYLPRLSMCLCEIFARKIREHLTKVPLRAQSESAGIIQMLAEMKRFQE